jgi:diguanylate cyclase (GGDEF)-like protein
VTKLFYIGLENQIHLLIILFFSTYIYLSSLSLKLELFYKNFGASFFIPLVLSIISFLSLNSSYAESYLFFAEFVHITTILIILALKKAKEINYIFFVASYAFPLITVVLNINFNYMQNYTFLNLILYLYIGVLFIIIISNIIMKNYSLLLVFTGAISICASLLVKLISSLQIATILSLVFKVSGYMFFAYFFYKNTINKLEKSYYENMGLISRINMNIQGEVNRRVEEIERSNKHLVELYKTDSLTGVYNKKAIMGFIDSLVERKKTMEFSVIMFDIDNFKEVNDTYGHIVGDKCIKSAINIVKSNMRIEDEIGRYGGDEFIIVMAETTGVKAYLAADRMRKSIEETSDPHFTISAGVASYPSDATTTKDLISAADRALYTSKENGRNRVTHIGQLYN